LLLAAVYQLHAQKNIDGLINAEKSFAAYSVAHGIKDAFLKFLDSNGVMFDQGKAVNGIESWNKKEKRQGILNWAPEFAEISSSNDFGYTTGPWTFQPKTVNDSVVARGQYFTVWHLDKNGEWKFLVDLGIGNTPINPFIKTKKIVAKKTNGNAVTDSVLKAEENFIAAYHENLPKAYRKYLSNKTILNRNGRLPAISIDDQLKVIKNTPLDIQFSITGSGIASSGDLAYVYGNTTINNKNENYLHIWRKGKDGWKIAVEVLRY
jgi:ketosteroid isomerase-like protein